MWSLGGLVTLMAITGWEFYLRQFLPSDSGSLTEVLILNAQAGAVAGLMVGLYDARARETASERERELERRKQAEARYRSLFENSPVAVWEVDLSEAKEYVEGLKTEVDDIEGYLDENPDEVELMLGKVEELDVNENALDYYEAETKEELINSADSLMTEETREVYEELLLKVADGETEFRSETVSMTLDGRKRYEIVELYVPEAYADDYSRAYITGTDITDRKEREKELKKLSEEYSTVLDSTEDTIFLVGIERVDSGVEFRYERLNEAYEKLTGLTTEEVRGRTPVQVFGDEAGRALEENYRHCLEKGEPIRYDERLSVPEGEKFWQTTLAPSVVEGEVIRIVGIAHDMTDRVRREQELRETKEELERSNRDLEQFAYVASHDLQEPLRTVSSYLDLLKTEYGEELDEEANGYIEFAVDGAERMQSMVKDLLTYSRVQTREGEFDEVDTGEVIEDVLLDLRKTVEIEDATVTHDELPKVRADRSRMTQLFQNLIRNGIEHTVDRNPEVHVGVNEREDVYEFYVEDNGEGVPEDQQHKVFEVFEQAGGRTDGTGIGLAICRRIVEQHGGDIRVDSEDSEGSTFYFTIPK
jgi:PAS domain S-box-containing protein